MAEATQSIEPAVPPLPWPVRRILLWWIFMNLTILWQGPSYLRAFRPDFFPPGYPLFLPDFFQEWASARNSLEGLPVYTSQELTLERYLGIKRKPEEPRFIEYNAHPPTSALLVLPLAKLDFANAFLIWNVVSLVALGLSMWLIVRQSSIAITFWCAIPTVTLLLLCNPLWHQLVHGQLNLILLLLIVGTWAADRTGHPYLAGALLGSATAIKLFPGFLFVYFLFRRQWKPLAAGAGSFLGLVLLGVICFGADTYRFYVEKIIPNNMLWRAEWSNMSVAALWCKLFDPEKQWSGALLIPIMQSLTIARIGIGFSWAVILGILARITSKAKSRAECDMAFGISMVAMLLAGPITWDHYCLLLMLPVALLWQRIRHSEMARGLLWMILVVLFVQPAMLMDHFMILVGAEYAPGTGWISYPGETLLALSVPLYALIGLFALAVLVAKHPSAEADKGAPLSFLPF